MSLSTSVLLRLRHDVLDMLREQREYVDVLVALVRREFLVRYKQTAIGIGWAVLVPLLQMAIFTLVFTRAVPMETDLPYPVFAYSGLLPWNLFAGAVKSSASSMTDSPQLVTNVYFPREMFPFSTVIVELVDFALALCVLGLLMLVYQVPVGWTALLLPGLVLVEVVFAAGVGLMVAMANLFYRDFRYITGVALMVWMFLTSVVYPVENIGGSLGRVLTTVNPLTPIIEAQRSVLLRGEVPTDPALGLAMLTALATLAVAWVVFHRGEFRFAERI